MWKNKIYSHAGFVLRKNLRCAKKQRTNGGLIMEEKVLKKNKNGMAMLMLFIALYVAAIAAIVSGAIMTETAESAKSVISIILIVIVLFMWA